MDIGQTFLGNSSVFGGDDLTPIGKLVSLFVKSSFVLAGVAILFFFITAGVGMIAAAGQNDPQKAEAAKKTLTSAVIGFAVVFASYWIVKLIGRLTGLPNLI